MPDPGSLLIRILYQFIVSVRGEQMVLKSWGGGSRLHYVYSYLDFRFRKILDPYLLVSGGGRFGGRLIGFMIELYYI